MVKKAEVQGKINAVNAKLTAANAKLEALTSAHSTLSGTNTSIEYVLKSHENIKATYHLAGTPYLKETEDEKENLTTTTAQFDTQKTTVLEQLQTKINQIRIQIAGYNDQLKWLSLDLRYAED
ncbi:hypothetical protein [Streptococcus oricebi]|uniref:DUF5082 domain-containing protein n=1 Tax=Streptococcus oricebi TaxID=1547447 RepID=A0ABS5B7B1_9STRE|nr:hypothetical protein [Streptococcus oricebi]MBP2623899.1 hypothetical protein [Streptococcus oricebi]